MIDLLFCSLSIISNFTYYGKERIELKVLNLSKFEQSATKKEKWSNLKWNMKDNETCKYPSIKRRFPWK